MSGNPILRTAAVAACVALLVSTLVGPASAAHKSDCKDGGWKTLTTAGGDSFKNQGQCVEYVIHGGTFEQPEVVFAVAYSDLDGDHVFNGGDQVISKVVDNGDGSLGPGDLIETIKYPTSLDPTTTDFADWGIDYHTVQTYNNISPTQLVVTSQTGGTFAWVRDFYSGVDGYYESSAGVYSAVYDYFGGSSPDIIVMNTGSPSQPTAALNMSAYRPNDDRFIDVELFS